MPRSHLRPSTPEGLEWEAGIRCFKPFPQVIPGLGTPRLRNSALLLVLNLGCTVQSQGKHLKYTDGHAQGNLIYLVWGKALSYSG